MPTVTQPSGLYVIIPIAQATKVANLASLIDARLGIPRICDTCGGTHETTWDRPYTSPDGTQIAYRIEARVTDQFAALQAQYPSTVGKLPAPIGLDATWIGAVQQ